MSISKRPSQPVRCHRCLIDLPESEGYWFAISPWIPTRGGLPIAGHLYCEACIDRLYDEARRIRRPSLVIKRFLLKRRRPDRFQTTMQASQRIRESNLSLQEWRTGCREAVSWWWERRALVSNGMAPPWADPAEVDTVIGKYRSQHEPWEICVQVSSRAHSTAAADTAKRYDDLVQRFPAFAAYALYSRGVWRQSLTGGQSGTAGLARAATVLHASPGFRGAIWLGTPSREVHEHAEAGSADLTAALNRDPQLCWAYFYRSGCKDTLGDAVGSEDDARSARELSPGLKKEWNFVQQHSKDQR